ncbi:MAG TPA: hypothetical protein VEQ40_12610, partial [Pyrinomonadaceae bacterium]|nr:hypothetical protein [Pyrinomonadaceae bacterium]
NPVKPPAEYYWGFGFAFGSLILLGLTFWPTQSTYRKYRDYEEERQRTFRAGRRRRALAGRRVPESARKILDKVVDVSETALGNFVDEEQTEGWYSSLMLQFNLLTWPLVTASILSFWGAILIFDAFRGLLTPFGHSLLVMLTLVWATLAVILALRYSDWLSRMASKVTVKFRHWGLVWAFSLSAALGVIFGFALFGRYNTAADLVTDVLLMLVTLAIFGGLTTLGAFKIMEVTKGRGWRVFGGVLGFFHALIQFLIPFLLVRKGNALAWIVWLALMIAMPFVGWGLMKKNWLRALPVAWLGFGVVMMMLPHAAFHTSKYFNILQPSSPTQTTFTAEPGAVIRLLAFVTSKLGFQSGTAGEPSGWMLLVACFVAAGVGLLMACAWLSWYLAVALVFNGHNNEAGGAARIEKFKQFVRFRLTENDLTGFVIAVDEPKEHGSQLRPKLIDVIYLRPKRGANRKAPGAHA